MRTSFRALAVAGGILALAGCGGTRAAKVPVIEETWLARVPQAQLEPVYEKRSDLRRAQDEVTRAKVQVTDASNQLRVAEAQRVAAAREEDVAKANLEVAKEMAQRPAIDRAERQLEVARLAKRTAEEKVELQEHRLEAAEASLKVEQAQVDSARVALARSEFEVLRQTGDTRVEPYDPADFDKAAATASANEAEALQAYQKRIKDVEKSQKQLDQSRQRLQAAKQGTPDIG